MKPDFLFALLSGTSITSLAIPYSPPSHNDLFDLTAIYQRFNLSDEKGKTFDSMPLNRTLLPRTLISETCGTGPLGDHRRRALESTIHYVAQTSTVLRLAASPEMAHEDDTRLFYTAFGKDSTLTRKYISKRYAALEREADKHQEGYIMFRCDDPWLECTRNRGMVMIPHERGNQIILVRSKTFLLALRKYPNYIKCHRFFYNPSLKLTDSEYPGPPTESKLTCRWQFILSYLMLFRNVFDPQATWGSDRPENDVLRLNWYAKSKCRNLALCPTN